jgi:hypothetical protein
MSGCLKGGEPSRPVSAERARMLQRMALFVARPPSPGIAA